jgi:hypothetical protein
MNNGRAGRNEQREVERGEWGRRGIVKGKLEKSLLELGPAYCTSIVLYIADGSICHSTDCARRIPEARLLLMNSGSRQDHYIYVDVRKN